jgi:predicted RNA-binding protein with RPS1 domain
VVTARVLNIDSANHRLGLSLRQAWEEQQQEESNVRSDDFYFAEPPINYHVA